MKDPTYHQPRATAIAAPFMPEQMLQHVRQLEDAAAHHKHLHPLVRLVLLRVAYNAATAAVTMQQLLDLQTEEVSGVNLQHKAAIDCQQLHLVCLQLQEHVQQPQRVSSMALLLMLLWDVNKRQLSWQGLTKGSTPHQTGPVLSSSMCVWMAALTALGILFGSSPTARALAATAAGAVAVYMLLTGSRWRPAPEQQQQEQQQQPHAVETDAPLSFTVYSCTSELPAEVLVTQQPDHSSSAVGYTAWPVTGAGRRQALLFTHPRHFYGPPKQQQQQQASAPGVLEQESSTQQVPVASHPVLCRRATRLAKHSSMEFLQQLSCLQLAAAASAPHPQPLLAPVLWVCLDTPMMLQQLQPSSTLAHWLKQEQEQQQEKQQQAGQELTPLGVTADGQLPCRQWHAPFPAAAWPLVLVWLQDVVSALSLLHRQHIVHGGVHAGAVHLQPVAAAAAPSGCSISCREAAHAPAQAAAPVSSHTDSGTAGKPLNIIGQQQPAPLSLQQQHQHQQQQQQDGIRAVLSLASPWQREVTVGRVVYPGLAPPELLSGGPAKAADPYTSAVDVYGVGMLMWQLATGWVPQQQQQQLPQQQQQQQQQHERCVSGESALDLHGDVNWCCAMRKWFGTTFPGAVGDGVGALSCAGNMQQAPDEWGLMSGRHGVLPAAADNWLPVGYRSLMAACCSTSAADRPSVEELSQQLQQLVGVRGSAGSSADAGLAAG